MEQIDIQALITELIRDEGARLTPYRDSRGYLTTGIGRCLDTRPFSPEECRIIGHDGREKPLTYDQARWLLGNDVARTVADLDRELPWWRMLSGVRQRVIANMGYNLGVGKLCGFLNTLKAVREQRWDDAAHGMLASLWAKQVGQRAVRLADMMRKGG